jgi:ABC-type multidrug transport system ATPase subunit/pSer/pThr/pTyr-binding forkhead associated (FHA) protein
VALSSADAQAAISMGGRGQPSGQPPAPSMSGDVHEVTVGRAPDNRIVFDNPVVSGHHARLTRYPQGGILVQDLGSTNGTYLRGQRIQQQVVTLQDDIYLGSAPLRMSDPRVAPLIIQLTPQLAPAGHPLTVGSNPQCAIRIHDPHVAPHHCTVRENPNGSFDVQDAGAGTAIDNAQFRIQTATANPTSNLLLGSFVLPLPTLRNLLDTARGEAGQAAIQAAVQGLNLQKPETTIGRAPGNDLVLPHPSVSGRHAVIRRQQDGTFAIQDLGSTNGTYIDGQRVQTAVARPGQSITVGAVTLVLGAQGIESAQRAQVRLDLIKVSMTVTHRKTGQPLKLLDDVNMSIFPGELIGMLGPSGAGKSTLLMTVLGLIKPDRGGGVLLNGKPLFQQYESFRTNVGYVPQDDIVHPELTVREALRYACALRLPQGTKKQQIEESIEATLKEVGLWEQRDVAIGSAQRKTLSGGQRRRVNLAVELVTDPSLLILDEPTSGLSWTDAADVISTLRRLADNGRTIVVTIHQPDYQEYEKFDSVCILGRGGKLLFFGPPNPDSYDFFGAAPNKPREMFDHLEQLAPDEWRARFQGTETYRRFVVERQISAQAESGEPPKPRPRSSFRQFPVLLSRSALLTRRNMTAFTLLTTQAILLAVLIGLTTGGATSFAVPQFGCSTDDDAVDSCEGVDDRYACDPTRRMAVAHVDDPPHADDRVKDPRTALLAILMALFLPMIIASSNVLVAERVIYERERLAGLNIVPYILARLLVLFALGAWVVLLHVPIAYFMCGLGGGLHWYLIIGVLTTSTASAMGMALSASVQNPVSALWGINFLVIPQLLFAGSISRLEELSVTQALSWLTATRYGLEALTSIDLFSRTISVNEDDGVLLDCQVERYLDNMPNFFSNAQELPGELVLQFPIVYAAVGMGVITFVAFVFTSLRLKMKDK